MIILSQGGDNGNEPIRIGLGEVSNQTARCIVEYCYWENTGKADSESISIKSMENIIRYNVFNKNLDAMLVFRNGDRNVAYGNMFIGGSGGMRIKEANDILIFNNYFDSANSIKNPALSFDFQYQNKINNVTFVQNTLVNSCVDMGLLIYKSFNTPKINKNINFINNIMVNQNNVLFYDYLISKYGIKYALSDVITFDSNIFEAPKDLFLKNEPSIFLNERNFVKTLVINKKSNGFYGLAKSIPTKFKVTQPFIFSGISAYIDLNEDIDEFKRPPNQIDFGCEQLTDKPLANLNKQRGPSYLKNPTV